MKDIYDFLSHHGVKGMRWGVRRKSVGGRPSTEGKEAQRILEKHKTQGIKSLTNHELRVLNQRQLLEKSFEMQNPKPPTIAKRGQKFAKEILTAAGAGSSAAIGVKAYKFIQSPKGKEFVKKGKVVFQSSKFLKLSVKKLPNPQLTLF